MKGARASRALGVALPLRGLRSIGRLASVWVLSAVFFCLGAIAGLAAQTQMALHGMGAAAMPMSAECADEMGDASGPAANTPPQPGHQAEHAVHPCCAVPGCGSVCVLSAGLHPASVLFTLAPVDRRATGVAVLVRYASPALAPPLDPPIG